MKPHRRRMSIGIGSGIFAIGIVFTVGFNVATEATNTETFCIGCHELEQTVYQEYQGTIHDNNSAGVRAAYQLFLNPDLRQC